MAAAWRRRDDGVAARQIITALSQSIVPVLNSFLIMGIFTCICALRALAYGIIRVFASFFVKGGWIIANCACARARECSGAVSRLEHTIPG